MPHSEARPPIPKVPRANQPSIEDVNQVWQNAKVATEVEWLNAGKDPYSEEGQRWIRGKFRDRFSAYSTKAYGWTTDENLRAFRMMGFPVEGRMSDDAVLERQAASAAFTADKEKILANPLGTVGALAKGVNFLSTGIIPSPEEIDQIKASLKVGMMGLDWPRHLLKSLIIRSNIDLIPGEFETKGPIGKFFNSIGKNLAFQEDAAELRKTNPEEYSRALRLREIYGVPGFKNPGEQLMIDIGMHPWEAQILSSLADPVIVVDKPFVFLAKAVPTTRFLWAMYQGKKVKKLVPPGAGKKIAEGNLKFMDEAMHWKATPQVLTRAEQAVGARTVTPIKPFGANDPGAKSLAEFEKLGKIARPTVDELKPIDFELATAASEMSQMQRAVLLQMRSDMATTQESLVSFQKMFSRYSDEMSPEMFQKGHLNDAYYNLKTGEQKIVPAGIVQDFFEAATDDKMGRYLIEADDGTVRWATQKSGVLTKEAAALKKAVGASPEDLIDLKNNWSFMGNEAFLQTSTRAMFDHMREAGIRNASRNGLWQYLHKSGIGRAVGKLRQPIRRLQESPVMQPVVRGFQAKAAVHEGDMAELIQALGGKVWKYDDTLAGAVRGGVGRVSGKLNKVDDELVDALGAGLGGPTYLKAINARRLKNNLKPLTMAQAKAHDPDTAVLIRMWTDRMGRKAIDQGMITPNQWITEYLPIINSKLAQGFDVETAWRGAEKYAIAQGKVKETRPLFTMQRNGEMAPDELNILKVLEGYSQAINRDRYLLPVIRDAERIIKSTAFDPALRETALDFLKHARGDVSTLQLRFLQDGINRRNVVLKAIGETKFEKSAADYDQMIKRHTRVIADMFYNNFMGFKMALAARNWTQKSLALGILGKGVPGGRLRAPEYIRESYARGYQKEPQARFSKTERLAGWSRNAMEFADDTAVQIGKGSKFGNLQRELREKGMFHFVYEDMGNRFQVYMAAEGYVDDLWNNMIKGGNGFEVAAKRMTVDEGARLKLAFKEKDLDAAYDTMGRWMVNETQYLYHPLNRPEAFRGPIAGLAYMFQTWPQNYAEASAQAFKTGFNDPSNATLGPILGRTGKVGQIGAGFEELGNWYLPYVSMGYGLNSVGRHISNEIGYGPDLGDWVLPEAPDWYKKAFGHDTEDDVKFPIPKAAFGLPIIGRIAASALRLDKGAAGGAIIPLATIDAATELFTNVLYDGLFSPDENIRAKALETGFNRIPWTPTAGDAALRQISEYLGIGDINSDNSFEQVLGAFMQQAPAGSRRDHLSPYQDFYEANGFRFFDSDVMPQGGAGLFGEDLKSSLKTEINTKLK